MPNPTVRHGYDLLGWLCSIVSSLDTEKQRMLFRQFGVPGNIREKYYQRIEETFPFLNRIGGEQTKLFNMFSVEQLELICQQVLLWKEQESDCIFIIAVLSYLERYLDFGESIRSFMQSAEFVSDNVVSFRALNENNFVELGGCLLPNYTPIWKKGGRSLNSLAEMPLSIMEKYIWAPHRSPWSVCNLYSAEWEHSKNTPVRIVCSPISNESTFEYELKKGSPYNTFEITKYYQDRGERVRAIIENTIQYAGRNNADVVLFPEMLASPKCQHIVQEFIESQTEFELPKITILPSSEYRDNTDKWINETWAVDYFGEKLMAYQKQHAFQLDVKDMPKEDDESEGEVHKYYEPITPNHNLYVLHMGGIGRAGVIICADIFDVELVNTLLVDYQINMLLVLAYTPGFRLFFDKLALAQSLSCEVVWCNTCSAYESNDANKPCVSYMAFGHNDRGVYYEKSCGRNLPDVCNGCICEIQIAATHKGKGKITRKMLE